MDSKKIVVAAFSFVAIGFVGGFYFSKERHTALPPVNSSACFREGAKQTDSPLFNLDGNVISLKEIPPDARATWLQLQADHFKKYREFAEESAARFSLAKKNGFTGSSDSVPELQEILRDKLPSEEKVKKYFESNRNSFPKDLSYEKIAPDLKKHLDSQFISEAVRSELMELHGKKNLQPLVPQACSSRIKIDLAKVPRRGAEKSNVEVVYFTGYSCPQCRSMSSEVERFANDSEKNIHFAQIVLARPGDRIDEILAAGAVCANKIDPKKFWKFNEKMLSIPPVINISKTAEAEAIQYLKGAARDAEIDESTFVECLTAPATEKDVIANRETAVAAGFINAPGFLINGHRVFPSRDDLLVENVRQILREL